MGFIFTAIFIFRIWIQYTTNRVEFVSLGPALANNQTRTLSFICINIQNNNAKPPILVRTQEIACIDASQAISTSSLLSRDFNNSAFCEKSEYYYPNGVITQIINSINVV
jgi:hypothetical protein